MQMVQSIYRCRVDLHVRRKTGLLSSMLHASSMSPRYCEDSLHDSTSPVTATLKCGQVCQQAAMPHQLLLPGLKMQAAPRAYLKTEIIC